MSPGSNRRRRSRHRSRASGRRGRLPDARSRGSTNRIPLIGATHRMLGAAALCGDGGAWPISRFGRPACSEIHRISNEGPSPTGSATTPGQAWRTGRSNNRHPPKATILHADTSPADARRWRMPAVGGCCRGPGSATSPPGRRHGRSARCGDRKHRLAFRFTKAPTTNGNRSRRPKGPRLPLHSCTKTQSLIKLASPLAWKSRPRASRS